MIRSGSVLWFATHESRLVWRDAVGMFAGQGRRTGFLIGGAALAVFMHGLAYSMIARFAHTAAITDVTTLASVTVTLILAFSLMLSQALESATRAFYARADLDLILSSPVDPSRLFAVRIAAIGCGTILTAALISAPFINVLAWEGGSRWLGAYLVVAALGMLAGAAGITATVAMFRMFGPKRTRLIAQIAAAVIGAGFLIALQAIAVLSFGTMSRYAFLDMAAVAALLPSADGAIWFPARAMLGDTTAMLVTMALGSISLLSATLLIAPGFARHATAVQSAVFERDERSRMPTFRTTSPRGALRRKEWMLLKRDPWLVSQSLMQILYLLPPALLLWRSYEGLGSLVVLVPVLVMGAGQLAGGLAWLAVSGEDAPDLVQTAPLSSGVVLRAKVEAVLGAVSLLFLPFVAALTFMSVPAALFAALGIGIAAASATAIQLWFRVQARRSTFRRRQTSSRVATFAEAFSSISWAGAAALAVVGTWPGVVLSAALGSVVLATARAIRPR